MPYQVTKAEGDTESPGKTRIEMAKELKGLEAGKSVLGYIGAEPPTKREVPPQQKYSSDEINEMTALQNLLKKYVVPPALGTKFSDQQAKIRFIRKVERQSLQQLQRFWDGAVPEDGVISIEEQSELNRRWEETSP